MLVRLILISIIKDVLCCMDSLCTECISVKLATQVQQTCISCQPNYALDGNGMCIVSKSKLLSLGITAILMVVASLVVRHILITNSRKKRKIYTAEYQQQMMQFMISNKMPNATEHAYIAYTDRGLQAIPQQNEQEYVEKCDCCIRIEPQFDKIDAFTQCKHMFHCKCLRKHFTDQYKSNRSQIGGRCPTCNDRVDYLSLYCQSCHQSSREMLISQKESLYGLNSFTCYRCRSKQKALKILQEEKMCCGMGKYFCCHWLRN